MQPCSDCFPLGLDQIARLIMADDLRYSSHGSCNDGRPEGHSIQQCERQAFLQRYLRIDRGSGRECFMALLTKMAPSERRKRNLMKPSTRGLGDVSAGV